MKEPSKEKSLALVSRKEVMKHINESNDLDQGEESGEDIIDELVASATLIFKRYEESRSNRARRA